MRKWDVATYPQNEELKSTLTEMEVHFDLTKQTQFKDKLEL